MSTILALHWCRFEPKVSVAINIVKKLYKNLHYYTAIINKYKKLMKFTGSFVTCPICNVKIDYPML
jgi:hypothetical protein